MSQDRYKRHVDKASALIQHLGRAVRGSRAFFVYRDRSDPAQPQIIACHPPLTDDELLRCLGSRHVVCEQVSEDASHTAMVGIVSDSAFDNDELAHEMTAVAAQSLAAQLCTTAETFDGPTGLPDRAAFVHMLTQRIDASEGDGVAVLVMDLDRFHRVIARFGDAGGEEIMRVVTTRLSDILDPRTVVARLGMDRLGIMLVPEATEESALAVAGLVHDALRAAIQVADEAIFVTASIGVALGMHEWRPSNLLHDADLAVSIARTAGGGATRVFRAGMDNLPAFQLLRERDVRLAVTRDEFTVFFQPIVDAMRGGLHAFEALLRWRNPDEGLLPPSTFLDVLHETGLIDTVGRKVIRDSCEHAARWLALGGSLVPVSVNISPVQLYADDFCDHIAQTLAETGLPAAGLILELTENAFIDDATKVRATVGALKRLGIRVLIDDFGTGYSSLSYLHELPVSGIKLDRMWFRSIETSETQREIVRTIVGLAHFMHMDVVAEGIENATQLTAARDLHCDFAQGFCFARPFDAEHATRYLAQTLSRGAAA
jgi:diguanylate cyclase (GGDEF)-like protein